MVPHRVHTLPFKNSEIKKNEIANEKEINVDQNGLFWFWRW